VTSRASEHPVAGLDPATHVPATKAWMAGTSLAMGSQR